jgi:hypothetical protein
MTALRITLLLLTLGLLAACDEPPTSPKPVPASPEIEPATNPAGESSVVAATAPAALAKSVMPQSQADVRLMPAGKLPLAPVNRAKADKDRVPSVNPQPPTVRLDLRLPAELVEQMELDEPLAELPSEPLLPPLFGERPAEPGPFQLNGRLITNEQSKDYWDSVEGAEMQFEFRH